MSLIAENIKIFGEYTDLEQLQQIKEFSNVGAMLKHCFENYKDINAIVDQNTNYTYNHLSINTGFIRYQLNKIGVKPGDNVGVLFSNSIMINSKSRFCALIRLKFSF